MMNFDCYYSGVVKLLEKTFTKIKHHVYWAAIMTQGWSTGSPLYPVSFVLNWFTNKRKISGKIYWCLFKNALPSGFFWTKPEPIYDIKNVYYSMSYETYLQ